jgi:hypothetical protein
MKDGIGATGISDFKRNAREHASRMSLSSENLVRVKYCNLLRPNDIALLINSRPIARSSILWIALAQERARKPFQTTVAPQQLKGYPMPLLSHKGATSSYRIAIRGSCTHVDLACQVRAASALSSKIGRTNYANCGLCTLRLPRRAEVKKNGRQDLRQIETAEPPRN